MTRWVVEVSRALNGGREGGDVLSTDVTPNISGLGSEIEALALNVGQVAATSPGLSAIPAPAQVTASVFSPGDVVMGPVGLSVTGGTSPYSVVWSDPEGLGVTFGTPNGVSTTVSVYLDPGAFVLGRVLATVTDAALTSVQAWVSVRAQETGSLL